MYIYQSISGILNDTVFFETIDIQKNVSNKS